VKHIGKISEELLSCWKCARCVNDNCKGTETGTLQKCTELLERLILWQWNFTYITTLCNVSFQSATLPASQKQAVVLPTLKKPSFDPNNLSSYRSISNLTFSFQTDRALSSWEICHPRWSQPAVSSSPVVISSRSLNRNCRPLCT